MSIFNEDLLDEIADLRFVLRQIIDSLPINRDWLDPALEKRAKELIK